MGFLLFYIEKGYSKYIEHW